MNINRVMAAIAVSTLTIALGVSSQTYAQAPTANTGNGLKVTPVRNDLVIQPGTGQTVNVSVENITDTEASLRSITNDFEASNDESGVPRILLDETKSAPSHGLKQYIKKVPDFKVAPRKTVEIPVRIEIPAGTPGGGYFGAVRFAPTSVQGGRNVSLSASVGSLMLVTVPGDYQQRLNLESYSVANKGGKASSLVTDGSKLQNVVRMRNTGDVQEQPFGKIILKRSGQTVGEYEFNNSQPRGSVLPDSIRRFEVDMLGKANTFGKYTLTGSFGYGQSGQTINAATTFYVVPLPYMIGFVLLLIGLVTAGFLLYRRFAKRENRGHRRR